MPVQIEDHPVESLGGQTLVLLTEAEASFYKQAQANYIEQNIFSHESDRRALDRIVFLELLIYRYTQYLTRGRDYYGNPLEPRQEADLRKSLKETGVDLLREQETLGLTKKQRDEDHDSVGAYLVQLKTAAKQMGVHREKQLGRALELLQQIFSLAGTFQRANAEERKKLGMENAEDLIQLIDEVLRPQYDEVDQHFRKNVQRYWVRSL